MLPSHACATAVGQISLDDSALTNSSAIARSLTVVAREPHDRDHQSRDSRAEQAGINLIGAFAVAFLAIAEATLDRLRGSDAGSHILFVV
jgi:hypothetical protein